MAISLSQFARNMQRVATRLPSAVNVVVQAVAREVHRTVVLETPVDEGDARSNWFVTISTPLDTIIPAYAPGSKLGKGERANAAGAVAQGIASINARLPGQTIYIQNNVPYIGILNNGYSLQSPAGFVETAIITGITSLDGKTLKLI